MKRTLVALAAVIVMFVAAVYCETRLRSIGRVDPLGRDLLYLPSPTMLRLVSLGNQGLMADLLYLWSIQYYSGFRIDERFPYLEAIYDEITDLDPLYFDAYRIGAMIMTIEHANDPKERRNAVEHLYDKGLANMPDSWELAEVAAWDAYNHLKDRDLAIKYAGIGSRIPGAPERLKRVYGRWKDNLGEWTIEESVSYWQEVLAEAVRKPDVILAETHLYDALAALHHRQIDPLLGAYRKRFGRCPSGWQPMIDAGYLKTVPLDSIGKPYGIDQASCTLLPHKQIRWD